MSALEAALLDRLRAERGNPDPYDKLGDLYALTHALAEKALRNYLEAARLLVAGPRAPHPDRAARAAAILSKALPLARDRDPVLFRLAQMLEIAGQTAAAEKAYRELLAHTAAAERPLFHLALRERVAALDPWDLAHRRGTAEAREGLGMRRAAATELAELARLEEARGLTTEAARDAAHAQALAADRDENRVPEAGAAAAGGVAGSGTADSCAADAAAAAYLAAVHGTRDGHGPVEDVIVTALAEDVPARSRGHAAVLIDDPALGAHVSSFLLDLGFEARRLRRADGDALPDDLRLMALGTERLRGRSAAATVAAFRAAGRPELAVLVLESAVEQLSAEERTKLVALGAAIARDGDTLVRIAAAAAEAADRVPEALPPEPWLPYDDLPVLPEDPALEPSASALLLLASAASGALREGDAAAATAEPASPPDDDPVAAAAARSAALEASLRAREDDLRTARAERDQALRQVEHAIRSADEAAGEAASSLAAKAALRARIEELSTELTAHRARVTELTTDLAARRRAIEERDAEAAAERARHAEEAGAGLLARTELAASVAAVEEALATTRASLAAAQAESGAMRGLLDTTGTEREALRDGLASAEAERDTTRKALAAAEAERDTTRTALVAAEAERDTTRKALAAAEAERDTTFTALAAVETERDATRTALATVEAERDTTRTALATVEVERDATRTALATVEAERDTTRTALAAAEAERDTTRTALATVEAERDTTRTALATVEVERDTTRETLATVEAERDAARSDLAGARAEEARLQGRVRDLEREATEGGEALRTAHGAREKESLRARDLESALRSVEQALAAARAEYTQTSSALGETSRTLEDERRARAAAAQALEETRAELAVEKARAERLTREVDEKAGVLRERASALAEVEGALTLAHAEVARGTDARSAAEKRLQDTLRDLERLRDEHLVASRRGDELTASVARLEAEGALARSETITLRDSLVRRADAALELEKDRDLLRERIGRADLELERFRREAEERARKGTFERLVDRIAPGGGFGRGLALGLLVAAAAIASHFLLPPRATAPGQAGADRMATGVDAQGEAETSARRAAGERPSAATHLDDTHAQSAAAGQVSPPPPALPAGMPANAAGTTVARLVGLPEYAAIEQKLVRRQERPGYRLTAKLRTPEEVRAYYGYQASIRGTGAEALAETLDGPGGILRTRYHFDERTYLDVMVENLGLAGPFDVNALASSFALAPAPAATASASPPVLATSGSEEPDAASTATVPASPLLIDGPLRGIVSDFEEPVVVAGSGGGGVPTPQATTLHLEFPAPLRAPMMLTFRPPGGEEATLVWEALP